MGRFLRATISVVLVFVVRPGAAQQKGESRGNSKSNTEARSVQACPVTINFPESITKDQADAILKELRTIRQLLEKQEAELARGVEARPAATPSPERVQMGVGHAWNSIGRADAPVTVVEFTDFECPYCKQFHSGTFAELKKSYIDTGKVRWVTRDLPLDIHPHALKAAEAARCAGDQGKYWPMREALLSSDVPPADDVIKKCAEGLSLDTRTFQMCLDSEKFKADVKKDQMEAATLEITQTPTFVVAKTAQDKLYGVVIIGAKPLATFQSAIDALLKN